MSVDAAQGQGKQARSSMTAVFNSRLNALLTRRGLDSGALVLISGIVVRNDEKRLSVDDGSAVVTAHAPGPLVQGLVIGDYVDAFACVTYPPPSSSAGFAAQQQGAARPLLDIVGVQRLKDPNVECLRALEIISRAKSSSSSNHSNSAAAGPSVSGTAASRTPRISQQRTAALLGTSGAAMTTTNTNPLPKVAVHAPHITSNQVLNAVESSGNGADLSTLVAAVGAPALVVAALLEELQGSGMIYSAGDKYFSL